MRKFLTLHLLLMVVLPAVAQKKVPDFGVIDPAELRLASSPFETNASALKLFDITQVEFEPTGLSARMEIVQQKAHRRKISFWIKVPMD